MSSERQRLRPWLEDRINSGDVPGLVWIDSDKTKFRVTWKHAGKPDFNLEKDAALFRKWAEHTGKYKPGEQPDPSTWKTRFRCALHKMPDIEEIRVPHSLDDNEPYRVFRLKPRVVSSPKQRKNSINHSFSVPCPSPPLNDFNGFSYPPNGYHGIMCTQKNPVSMGYNPDLFKFPSPISSHTTSPSNTDFNGNLFEDIDRITPSIPPYPPLPHMPFVFDQPMEHAGFKQQQPLPAMSDDFFFKNTAGQYNPIDYEPTLTELQSVPRGEQFTYPGGGSGGAISTEGMTYNTMSYSMTGSSGPNYMFPGQNGTSHQMGLLKMLHSQPPVEMVQEISLSPTVTSSFGGNGIEVSYSSPTIDEIQPFMSHSMSMTTARETSLDAMNNHSLDKTETIWSCRVYYNNKEVSAFELNCKHTWKICYQNPDKQVTETGLNQSAYKTVLLPDSPTNEDDIQGVLDGFDDGLIVEMLHTGVTWVTKTCQPKVFVSRGLQDITKLLRDIRTKVFTLNDLEHRNPNDVERFMVSIGEEPLGALVKLVFVHPY